jgi:hypothetical protein
MDAWENFYYSGKDCPRRRLRHGQIREGRRQSRRVNISDIKG